MSNYYNFECSLIDIGWVKNYGIDNERAEAYEKDSGDSYCYSLSIRDNGGMGDGIHLEILDNSFKGKPVIGMSIKDEDINIIVETLMSIKKLREVQKTNMRKK